jgi:alpha/beta superfamily hydrolase
MAMGEKWSAYQPSKTVWLWSCVAAAALTMIVGFSWGGWVTGGTATKQAEAAGEQAAAQLAANICVHRFLAAPDAQAKLAELKEADSWKRDTFVEKGGWVTFAEMKEPVDGAAELCAEQLASAEAPAATTAEATQETTVN